MSSAPLPCVEVEPRRTARFSIVWLHGLGANGHDFEPIVPELGLDDLDLRFVFPHAPSLPVTINGGMRMPAWYDIRDLDLHQRHDEDGILRASEQVRVLLDREKARGIESRRIVLAGFSQGGAIAVHTGLRWPERLAGIVGLSTYLVRGSSLAQERGAENHDVPIFLAHGSHDPMVPLSRGAEQKDRLEQLGYGVTWKTYPMLHQVCAEEIEDLSSWFRKVLAS